MVDDDEGEKTHKPNKQKKKTTIIQDYLETFEEIPMEVMIKQQQKKEEIKKEHQEEAVLKPHRPFFLTHLMQQYNVMKDTKERDDDDEANSHPYLMKHCDVNPQTGQILLPIDQLEHYDHDMMMMEETDEPSLMKHQELSRSQNSVDLQHSLNDVSMQKTTEEIPKQHNESMVMMMRDDDDHNEHEHSFWSTHDPHALAKKVPQKPYVQKKHFIKPRLPPRHEIPKLLEVPNPLASFYKSSFHQDYNVKEDVEDDHEELMEAADMTFLSVVHEGNDQSILHDVDEEAFMMIEDDQEECSILDTDLASTMNQSYYFRNAVETYEDQCQRHLKSKLDQFTSHRERLEHWKTTIEPSVKAQQALPMYDIKKYGHRMMTSIAEKKRLSFSELFWRTIDANHATPTLEVARLYLSMLQLTNEQRVVIHHQQGVIHRAKDILIEVT
mmetsp:Transcript_2185/g.3161  ORF Transcript_2185/g.3161 Transcript_2185/m.3161 type:complete len:440 (-) Transcript_2185:44-1363(-)